MINMIYDKGRLHLSSCKRLVSDIREPWARSLPD